MSKVLKQVFKDKILDKSNVQLQAKIAAVAGKTIESVKRWVREDSNNLRDIAVAEVLQKEFGLLESTELYEESEIEPEATIEKQLAA